MVELPQVDEEQEVSVWKVLEVRYEDLIFVDKTERMPDKDCTETPPSKLSKLSKLNKTSKKVPVPLTTPMSSEVELDVLNLT